MQPVIPRPGLFCTAWSEPTKLMGLVHWFVDKLGNGAQVSMPRPFIRATTCHNAMTGEGGGGEGVLALSYTWS